MSIGRSQSRRPFVIIKCAMSLDGCLDDLSGDRLILSNEEDFDRVDAVRAECDAILVGAQTIRKDNPKLLIKSVKRRKERVDNGMPEHPMKVTVTASGQLSEKCDFFMQGDGPKIVFCHKDVEHSMKESLKDIAEVVAYSSSLMDPEFMLDILGKKGVRRLLIEGGSQMITTFIENHLVNELQISMAPFLIGQAAAPRFFNKDQLSYNVKYLMKLVNVEKLGDMVTLTYHFGKKRRDA